MQGKLKYDICMLEWKVKNAATPWYRVFIVSWQIEMFGPTVMDGWQGLKAVFFVMKKCHLNVWLTPDTVLLCKAYLWHLCYQEDAVSSPVTDE